jgi:hypothetical protein
MAGDYKFYQLTYRNKSTDAIAVAATDYSATANPIITPRNANYTIFVQKITVSPTTYAAKTWTFQDSTGTPVPYATVSIPATQPTAGADTEFVFDFGPTGVALSVGKSLDFKMSAAGAAGVVHVEAYEKLVTPVMAGAGTTN